MERPSTNPLPPSFEPLQPLTPAEFDAYRNDCNALVQEQLCSVIPADGRSTGGLYAAMSEYPLRHGKALRPALCIAACLALGGTRGDAVPSASVLELYHNAFLIHDDVEDGSFKRRNEATLHRVMGVPMAVNVGDGILALVLQPLLDNIPQLGLSRALRVLQVVARMSRETAEGQMMELSWIHRGGYVPRPSDVVRMLYKKTAWYSFVTPLFIAAEIANARALLPVLHRFGTLLGVAFQIIDDVLNLQADEDEYGKEIDGDLWEGKRTLIVAHALARATQQERAQALDILAKPRTEADGALVEITRTIDELVAQGALGSAAADRLRAHVDGPRGGGKTVADVAFLRELIVKHGALESARQAAARRVAGAMRLLPRALPSEHASVHHRFVHSLVDYVYARSR